MRGSLRSHNVVCGLSCPYCAGPMTDDMDAAAHSGVDGLVLVTPLHPKSSSYVLGPMGSDGRAPRLRTDRRAPRFRKHDRRGLVQLPLDDGTRYPINDVLEAVSAGVGGGERRICNTDTAGKVTPAAMGAVVEHVAAVFGVPVAAHSG